VSRSDKPLSIGEVSRATGLNEATLRAWERRFDFPTPSRGAGNQRRYSADELARIERVLDFRARGASLPTAIDRSRVDPTPRSFFATIRDRHPELAPIPTRKRDVLRLTRAIEDESAARAEPQLLIGAFQRERFYRQSERRWQTLDLVAAHTFVFARFDREVGESASDPTLISLDQADPAAREWVLICLAPEHAALLVAWEPPGRPAATDGDRQFELLYTLKPPAVREAARIALSLAEDQAPEESEAAERTLDALVDPTPSTQLDLAAAVTARTLASA
jgi:MerR family transcriptional regulator, light-induced transcriptional regulator